MRKAGGIVWVAALGLGALAAQAPHGAGEKPCWEAALGNGRVFVARGAGGSPQEAAREAVASYNAAHARGLSAGPCGGERPVAQASDARLEGGGGSWASWRWKVRMEGQEEDGRPWYACRWEPDGRYPLQVRPAACPAQLQAGVGAAGARRASNASSSPGGTGLVRWASKP